MITGREPFKGEKALAVLRAILEEEPEPLTGLRERGAHGTGTGNK